MSDTSAPRTRPQPLLAIHGGAGTILRSKLGEQAERQYREALHAILQAGQHMLLAGAPALEVVVEAVRRLEECELFNAGRGAVLTDAGTHELDASVMDGPTLRAGAVAGVQRSRNPVLAARAVMEHSGHVMLIGPAADAFAAAQGLEQVEPTWFGTAQRRAQWEAARAAAQGVLLDHDAQSLAGGVAPLDERNKFGTVGAVALDAQGALAAATSTGGVTLKRVGRVGDSPILGAGCYADGTVAVSCTGTGEAFMRRCVAYDVSARLRYAGQSLAQACAQVVMEDLPSVDGRGGLIAVSASGELCLPFNTEGMYRGWVRGAQTPEVGIYADA
ncbi:isoaspartyl peptidase/L-asparaginase family protein [Roseateles sp. BYS180W]|uniref:Isoaspartyl peptidase/L-asparaginase family protein n=1 Tax=Roseateles rivi TaxID=3299028 RepID=A0ABW7FVU0_9BURK